MNKRTLFAYGALMCLPFLGSTQTQTSDLPSLKYYLYEAQTNLNYARYYANDTFNILPLLDSTGASLQRLIDFSEQIVLPEVIAEPLSEQVMVDQQAETNYPSEYTYSDTTVIDHPDSDFDFGGGFPSFNPLRKMKSHFLVEIGINNFKRSTNVGIIPEISPGRSWFWNLGLTREIKLSPTFHLNFGLTYMFNGFSFGNDVILETDEDGTNPEFIALSNIKNEPCLDIHYLTIPLSLDINLSKSLKLNLGGLAGYRMYTSQNYSIRENSEEVEITRKDNYGLNNWMYGLKGGIGFGAWDIFFQYNVSNLFKNGGGQKFNVFLIGSSWRI